MVFPASLVYSLFPDTQGRVKHASTTLLLMLQFCAIECLYELVTILNFGLQFKTKLTLISL